jgi:hypothetical protein
MTDRAEQRSSRRTAAGRVAGLCVVLTMLLICASSTLLAEVGWGDSPVITIDVAPEVVGAAWTESDGFDLDATLVRRACADSNVFGTAGDMNCDGAINFDDIDPFVLALTGQAAYEAAYPNCNWLNADTDGDGTVTFDDIDGFVAVLAGG